MKLLEWSSDEMSLFSFWGSRSWWRCSSKYKTEGKCFSTSVIQLVIQPTLFLCFGFIFTRAIIQQLWKQIISLSWPFGQVIPLNSLTWGTCLTYNACTFQSTVNPIPQSSEKQKTRLFPTLWQVLVLLSVILAQAEWREAGFPACGLIYAMCLKFGNYSWLSSLPDFYFPGISFCRKKLLFLVRFPS